MDATRPIHPTKLLSLQETARRLAVSVDTLLTWNEHHILTPTITKDGTIGYSEEQIAFFQTIQKSFVRAQAPLQVSVSPQRIVDMPQELSIPKSDDVTTKSRPLPKLFMALSVLSAVGIIAMLTQGSQLSFVLGQFVQYQNQTANQAKVLGAQTSTLQFTPFNTFSTSVNLNSDDTKNKNLDNAGKNTAFVLPQQQKPNKTNGSTHANQVTTTTLAQLQKTLGQAKSASPQIANAQEYAKPDEASTLSPMNDNTNNGFSLDLGTLNTSNTIKNDTVTTTAAVGILGIMLFVLQSQLAVFGKRPQKTTIQPVASNRPIQKIIELEQKMDGSVVAVFQGKEYKICKPELYSDSDQFIERLMELTSMNEKEIEYDSFTDARLRLSTPLSRIVTRLNFVGLKRDLFFPRTSKNRVLFRRYITHQDLLTMNLTVANIASDLTKIA